MIKSLVYHDNNENKSFKIRDRISHLSGEAILVNLSHNLWAIENKNGCMWFQKAISQDLFFFERKDYRVFYWGHQKQFINTVFLTFIFTLNVRRFITIFEKHEEDKISRISPYISLVKNWDFARGWSDLSPYDQYNFSPRVVKSMKIQKKNLDQSIRSVT